MSDIFHGLAGGDLFETRMIEARVRRLLGSTAALRSFAEIYIGQNADL
jgi:p-hydroxybenzoate 3-monooxygenase